MAVHALSRAHRRARARVFLYCVSNRGGATPQAIAHKAQGVPMSTPFRVAQARFYAAEKRFNTLPDHLEASDPAAFKREERALFDTLGEVDRAPVASWEEFADAFEIACDGGKSLPNEDLVMKLLADARRLSGRA